MSLWIWAAVGLAWWAGSLAAAIPYRRGRRSRAGWARFTVGLPLTLAGLAEALRSHVSAAIRRAEPRPYRGFAPLVGSGLVAEAVALGVGLLVRALCGR